MTENYIIPRRCNGQPWTRGRMANVYRLNIQVETFVSLYLCGWLEIITLWNNMRARSSVLLTEELRVGSSCETDHWTIIFILDRLFVCHLTFRFLNNLSCFRTETKNKCCFKLSETYLWIDGEHSERLDEEVSSPNQEKLNYCRSLDPTEIYRY